MRRGSNRMCNGCKGAEVEKKLIPRSTAAFETTDCASQLRMQHKQRCSHAGRRQYGTSCRILQIETSVQARAEQARWIGFSHEKDMHVRQRFKRGGG